MIWPYYIHVGNWDCHDDKCHSFLQISKATEMNLSGNQERVEMEKKRLNWKVKDSSEAKIGRGGVVDPEKLVVELGPMEIRTFFVDFDYLVMFASE